MARGAGAALVAELAQNSQREDPGVHPKLTRTPMSIIVKTAFVAAVLLGVAALPPRSSAHAARAVQAAAYQPRFQTAACPFKLGAGIVAGRDVRCGYLVVPEDRSAPAGRSVKLAVAVFKSPAQDRAPDPLVFLQGGPGGAIVGQLGPSIDAQALPIITGRHDFILIDQRGTGYSQPSLACTELTQLQYATIDQNLSAKRQVTLETQAGKACHDRLVRAGVNLNAYTTPDDAADVADLRQALGYATMDLYGVSYGTRLALTTMRLYPRGLRSVVLDSVVQPQSDNFSDPLRSMRRSFDTLFQGCAAAAACNKAYPHLDQEFYALVTRLNSKPVSFRVTNSDTGKSYTALLNGDGLTNLLFQSLYVTSLIPSLPKMIDDVRRGDYGLAAKAYGLVEFDDSVSLGMYYAVECSEDAPFTNPGNIEAASRVLPPALRSDQLISSLGELGQCGTWTVKKVSSAQKQPVHSPIPTLVLAGQYDPITPPAHSKAVATALSHGYFYQFPGTGHGVFLTNACPYRITNAFVDDPSHGPDGSCVAGMTGPAFVTK